MAYGLHFRSQGNGAVDGSSSNTIRATEVQHDSDARFSLGVDGVLRVLLRVVCCCAAHAGDS